MTTEPVQPAPPASRVPATGVWSFKAGNSEIAFKTKHLMISRVRGSFREFEGEIIVDPVLGRSSVTARIGAASIDTGMSARDNDLRGRDFLNVEQFPDLQFASTGLDTAPERWKLNGDLTIAGRTVPVVLDVEFEGTASDPWGHTKAVFSAQTRINREDFGLTYNKAIEGGGVLIGSTVDIEIEIQAQHVADESTLRRDAADERE